MVSMEKGEKYIKDRRRKENILLHFILFPLSSKNILENLIFSFLDIFMDDQTKRTTFYESEKCKVYKKMFWRMSGM